MADETTKRHAPLAENRRTYASRKRTSLEVLRINTEKDVRRIVLEDILPNLVTQHGVLTSNVIASCNVICTLSQKIIDEALDILESVFRCFLPCLLHNVREVRTSALRAIRYLIRTGSHFEVFIKLHLDYLVARSLDLSTEASRNTGLHHLEQCENVQALRLVSHLVHIDPHKVPPALVRPLVALVKEANVVALSPPSSGGNNEDNSTEQTARACLLVLTELALLNPTLVFECGGLSVLLDSILSSMLSTSMRIPEAMLLGILHILNLPDTRKLLPDCQYIEHLISPLTSPSMYQLSLKNRKGSQEAHMSEMKLASSALLLTLRSWSGLLYLCQPKSTGIRSLTDVLVVGTPELQRHLLDFYYDVFQIEKLSAESLTSFECALESLDSQSWKLSWSLTEGFVAEEGLALLNYKSVSKMNLVDNHLSLLIIVFFSSGLIEGLCRLLVQSNTEDLSVMAGILLAELMHLSSVLLAPDHPVAQSASHTLSLLLDNDRSRRVMHWLERVHRLKEQTPQPYSPFLSFIISSASPAPAPANSAASHSVGAASNSRGSTMSSIVPGTLPVSPGAGSGGRIVSLFSNSSTNLVSSTGWLGDATEERPRHGSLSATHIKLIEALVDKAVAESNVLPPPHHRSNSSVSSTTPPLGAGLLDAASPDYWNWDILLCTVRRLLDSVCPTCAGHGINAAPTSTSTGISSAFGHFLSHHSHLHHHHSHHHQNHHQHDGRNNFHGSTTGLSAQHLATTRLVSWEEPHRLRFLRRLMTFFSVPPTQSPGSIASVPYSAHISNPSLHSQPLQRLSSLTQGPGYFAHRPHTWMWARKAATVATELFAYLSLYPSDSEPGGLLADVLAQFAAALRLVCPSASEEHGGSFSHDSILSPGTLERTCSHLLFLPVCQLTWSERGEHLLEAAAVTEALNQLITFTRCPLYIKLVVSSLDYTRQVSFSRLLLDRSTTASCEEGRIYVARFLRVLLRADLPFFSHWGIEIVHKQVHDAYLPVSREALATLQEACEEDANLIVLARLKPALLHQKFPGHAVACRLLGSVQEFRRLKLKNWIKAELDEWTGNGTYVSSFVEHIEESLFEAMTSYSRPTHIGDDLDRISSSLNKEVGRYVLAPMHPFGALAKHKEGMEFLRESGYLEGALQVLRDGLRISRGADPKHLRRLKSCLWSLGQMGSSTWGFDWLVDTDAIQRMLILTSNAGVLSVRGHAFWCLGLIGSTPRGAEVLRHKGWSVLRSDRLDKWPLQMPQWEVARPAPSRVLSDSVSSGRRRQDTRTESLTSSCDSRKSTYGEAGPHGEWATWLGNGSTTVRSLGRSQAAVASVGSSSDIRGYATLGRLRNRPALFASGSAHNLGGASAGSAVVRSGQAPVGGSLSSLYYPVGAMIEPQSDDSRRALRKISSLINPQGFPTEYRGIALPPSCHVLSSNLFASASSYHDESTLYDEEAEITQTEFEAIAEAHGSVFYDDQTADGHLITAEDMEDEDVANVAMLPMDRTSDVSHNSLSSASTSDYFSRTRSGSLGPLTQCADGGANTKIEQAGAVQVIEAVQCEEAKREDDEEEEEELEENEEDSYPASGPNPLTGLEFHSKDACIICDCGRGPSPEFSLSMAKPRREVMDCVEKLMSHIHPRKHEITLLSLRERYPDLLQDFCLFTEIALMLSKYRFNRAARTFLQEVFLELETASLYKMAQTVLPPLPEESDES